ncbi:hypothetical protein [Mucisphaera sp.]|uniref:hypothetical protein n=1 Tax=Mucisphaera sp. TaxID=2913024 RepID=UPI003D0FDC15
MLRLVKAAALSLVLALNGCQYLCLGEYYSVPLLMIGAPVLWPPPEVEWIPARLIEVEDLPRCVLADVPAEYGLSDLEPVGAWQFGKITRDRLDAGYCGECTQYYCIVYVDDSFVYAVDVSDEVYGLNRFALDPGVDDLV